MYVILVTEPDHPSEIWMFAQGIRDISVFDTVELAAKTLAEWGQAHYFKENLGCKYIICHLEPVERQELPEAK